MAVITAPSALIQKWDSENDTVYGWAGDGNDNSVSGDDKLWSSCDKLWRHRYDNLDGSTGNDYINGGIGRQTCGRWRTSTLWAVLAISSARP